ncbi:N-acetylglucosaminyl-phosphatidylinositol de-N-acetylase [Amia ocellicauda]|uniref:N-acetylglucosaminyl-phosphatidylinositol de-N-acetylase n=1 Tax=Amia ocellicauda TaxID=2972642 RepID=UPI003463CEF1
MLSFALAVILYCVWIKVLYNQQRLLTTRTGKARLLALIGRGCASRSKSTHGPHPCPSDEQPAADGIRALLVTAHPDDECMFFAPTVLQLLEINAAVHLLCLSSGNYYGQGELRKKELLQSCEVLGIPAVHVTVVDHRELPDDPDVQWDTHLVSTLILKQVQASSINLVLTFDGRGVSGHPNHIAIYRSISYLASVGKIPEGCCALALETVGLFRKYLSVSELPVSWMRRCDFTSIIGMGGYVQAKAAMYRHQSQLLWFRHVYLLLSRYMFVNTFQLISQDTQVPRIY